MIVKQKTIEENPALVYQLVLAHARATQYLKSHEDQWLKKASAFGTPMEILTKAAPNMELAWHMDASFIKKARSLGERMQTLGIIERQPDYEKLFDLTFIKRVMRSKSLDVVKSPATP
jgi:NitT/TauT family transport system substrate-binding protein